MEYHSAKTVIESTAIIMIPGSELVGEFVYKAYKKSVPSYEQMHDFRLRNMCWIYNPVGWMITNNDIASSIERNPKILHTGVYLYKGIYVRAGDKNEARLLNCSCVMRLPFINVLFPTMPGATLTTLGINGIICCEGCRSAWCTGCDSGQPKMYCCEECETVCTSNLITKESDNSAHEEFMNYLLSNGSMGIEDLVETLGVPTCYDDVSKS